MTRTGTLRARPNPIAVKRPSDPGATTLFWEAQGVDSVEVRVGAPDGPLFSRSGSAGSSQTGSWVLDGTLFYLQDRTDDLPLTLENTLATVHVTVATAAASVILMYHRIADSALDPWSLRVTPRHFSDHLEVIRKLAAPIGLQDLVSSHLSGHLPRRAVAVTFDDGYRDNLHVAKPLLEQQAIPSTVFITTDYVGRDRGFWWDELESALLRSPSLPRTLWLDLPDGGRMEWELGESHDYPPTSQSTHAAWKTGSGNDPTTRHAAFRAIHTILKNALPGERDRMLSELLMVSRPPHGLERPMAADEVCRLASGGFVDIGAHSRTHPSLSALPLSLQEEEVAGSRRALEDLVGRRVFGFSYPHGAYTQETMRLVSTSGYTYACASAAEPLDRASRVFSLPRLMVEDADGDEFARWLSSWLGR